MHIIKILNSLINSLRVLLISVIKLLVNKIDGIFLFSVEGTLDLLVVFTVIIGLEDKITNAGLGVDRNYLNIIGESNFSTIQVVLCAFEVRECVLFRQIGR